MATILGLVNNTNIADIDLQVAIIKQLQAVINQLIANGTVLENRLSIIDILKIKILSIKKYSVEKIKLKGLLT